MGSGQGHENRGLVSMSRISIRCAAPRASSIWCVVLPGTLPMGAARNRLVTQKTST